MKKARRPTRVLLSWSSGKDAAWTLHQLLADPEIQVVGLLTTLNGEFGRVAMHGVPEALLEEQASRTALPLLKVVLPWPCPNGAYEAAMEDGCARAKQQLDVKTIAFGDLLLEDVRRYRETNCRAMGLTPLFPIWGSDTAKLSRRMVDSGMQALVSCVDLNKLDLSFAGRVFDHSFLDDLPDGVDPCGENGEFHTFVYGGPMFSGQIKVRVNGRVEREGFGFADLVPADDLSPSPAADPSSAAKKHGTVKPAEGPR